MLEQKNDNVRLSVLFDVSEDETCGKSSNLSDIENSFDPTLAAGISVGIAVVVVIAALVSIALYKRHKKKESRTSFNFSN